MKPQVYFHQWAGTDHATHTRSDAIREEIDDAIIASGLASEGIVHPVTPMSKTEVGTLSWMHYDAGELDPATPMLYLHVKGASWLPGRPETPCVDDWRRMMTHFCVTRWPDAVDMLREYRAVGCNLSTGRGRPHFSGNFWWTTAGALKALPIPRLSWDRMEAEFWIGGVGIESMGSLHQSGVDHYFTRYPRECYEETVDAR